MNRSRLATGVLTLVVILSISGVAQATDVAPGSDIFTTGPGGAVLDLGGVDDGSFDVVVCACVYHHIEPNRRLDHLLEIGRVLSPGGLLLVFEHNRRNPLTRLIVRRCPIDSGANLLTGGLCKRLLQRAGFEGVRNRYYLFLPPRLHRTVGRLERALSFTGLGGQFCTHGAKAVS